MQTANLGTCSTRATSAHYASRVFLTNRVIATEDGDIPPRTLGLVLSRSVDGGVHEDLDLVNHGLKPVRFNLEIAIRSDFADLFEVKSGHIVRRGRIATEWSDAEPQLRTTYRNQDFCREVTILTRRNAAHPVYANGRISFEVNLPPGAAWHSCLLYELGNGKVRFEAPAPCIANSAQSRVGQRLAQWRQAVLKIRTSNDEFYRLFRQAVEDMAALRLPIERTDEVRFVPAAGVPWFVALFGRDSLIASLQNAIVYPGFACAALDVLGALQATERDDYRDAEPGKIMHELRLGELAHFKLVPHTPYYGTADATILYLIVLHVAWRCTGDAGLLDRHLKTAEGCLQWIDHYGDRDGDGFQEYATRSPVGYENQGWKELRGLGRLSRWITGAWSQGALRASRLRLRRLDAHGRNLRLARKLRSCAGAPDKGRVAISSFQRRVLGRGLRLLCLRAGWREKEGSDGRFEPRPLPVVGNRSG